MDIARPDQSKQKRRRRIGQAVLAGAVIAGLTIWLARLRPAAPAVDRSLVWIDAVKRGPMLRQVRGLGTLVPEEIRWIAARTHGRVERIVLRPGAPVEPDSVILVLNNPDVEQAASNAESQLAAAEAELVNLKVQVQRDVLTAESAAAMARSEFEQARLRDEVNDKLFKQGLVTELDLKVGRITSEQAAARHVIEQKRFAFAKEMVAPQVAVKEGEVGRVRVLAKLRRDDVAALAVRAGMTGVLQLLPVEVGAQVQPGANLARVADPMRLKAEVRVAETQAKDVQIGQVAEVDTRNGVVSGKVSRVDPSVQNGTVTVEIALTGALPRGARPDLSVDGMIELERLDEVVFVGRPAFGQEQSTVGIFKANGDKHTATEATRVQVKLGRSSVNFIEIVGGLAPGDFAILSDMSQWDASDRIKLN